MIKLYVPITVWNGFLEVQALRNQNRQGPMVATQMRCNEVRWSPPSNVIKINCNVAVHGEASDLKGEAVRVCGDCIARPSNVYSVELLAITLGLELAVRGTACD